MTPQPDDQLDKDALLQQLGVDAVKSPFDGAQSTAPTSNTMPIGGAPSSPRKPIELGAMPAGGWDTEGGRNQIKDWGRSLVSTPSQDPVGTVGDQQTILGSGSSGGVAPPKAQASIFQGFTPKHSMEGFAFDREQNTGKSAKDAFAHLANQAPPPPLNDKAALGAWFKQHIEPGMNELGHKVTSVEGDKFGFENWQGKFNVDFGRGAGAEGGALAWQVDDPSAVLSNGAYTPQAQGQAPVVPMGDTNPNTQDEIMAEIDALINGGNSQMDERALMELLNGAHI